MRISFGRRKDRRPSHQASGLVVGASLALAGGLLVAPVAAGQTVQSAAAAEASTSPDLDVLFIGAHPDDEAGRLSTYGQWNEFNDVTTGVITISRGEGGGNAVGPEEGPALGLIREAEERRAVGYAGIEHVYNLDKVDYYYTVSAPLTEEVWGHDDTLERVVRIIRETTPEVIVTMDPAPSPGNHGNHQYSGRMAFEGYNLAGDPTAFPGQIQDEQLAPWAPSKLLLQTSRGTSSNGPSCPTTFVPQRPTQNIYGVWGGVMSQEHGKTWAQIEREAQREYASQGWAVFPDVPTDPNQLGCDYFTQVEARVPFTRGDLTASSADPTTVLQGAVLPTPGGFPLGTGLEVDSQSFTVTPGGSTQVTATVTAPQTVKLMQVHLNAQLPDGWTVTGNGYIKQLKTGQSATRTFTVTAPSDAATNQRVLASIEMSGRRGVQGHGDVELEVVPAVRGDQELLPQVSDFQEYAVANGFPQMEGFVKPVVTVASGGSRQVDVKLTNFSDSAQSGEVTPQLPTGFSAVPASAPYSGLAAGDTTTVTFTVTNT
ncbi:MAG: PIG-L family deacetylase, partial [Nocardioidaceae bacterium]